MIFVKVKINSFLDKHQELFWGQAFISFIIYKSYKGLTPLMCLVFSAIYYLSWHDSQIF
jgi:hypothetical protein